MKTSLDNMQFVEDCLLGRAVRTEQVLFEAKLLLDPEFREEAHWQRKTYLIVRRYGRKRFRDELEQLHQTLFTTSKYQRFRDKMLRFFDK